MKYLIALISTIICTAFTSTTVHSPPKNIAQPFDVNFLPHSKLLSGEPDTSFYQFAFMVNNKYMVISSSPDSTWAKGAPYAPVRDENGIYSSITNITTESLPAIYSRLLNKKINICSSNGKTYKATIRAFKLLAAFTPHFSQVQQWQGAEGPALTDKQKALDIHRSGALYLVAEFTLDTPEKNAGDFYFAVPFNKRAPVLFSASSKDLTSIYQKSIYGPLSKTKDYITIQKEYIANTGNKKNNWWKDTEGSESFISFHINDRRDYVAVSHVAGNPCSEGFYAEKFSIWKLEKNTAPALLYISESNYSYVYATDIDGDIIPEFLVTDIYGHHYLLKNCNGKWEACFSWAPPFSDCPC